MREIRSIEGDTADLICYREFGYTEDVAEQLLAINPGLADLGAVIPTGTAVVLPAVAAAPSTNTLNLWD